MTAAGWTRCCCCRTQHRERQRVPINAIRRGWSRAGAEAGAAPGLGWAGLCGAVPPSAAAAMEKRLPARCSSRDKSGVGPFPAASEELRCELLAIRCQKPGLAAQSLLLAWQPAASTAQLFASRESLPDSLPRLAVDMSSPLLSLPRAQVSPGNSSHRLLSLGTATGSAPDVLQFNHPQAFKTKSIEIQRCLPNGERQELFYLMFLGDPSLPPAAALSPNKGSLSSRAPQRKI